MGSSPAVPSARLRVLVAGLVVAAGCSSMGSGCSGLEPIPSGRYSGPKTDNAVNLRLSSQGLEYLNRNWRSLIETLAPGGTLTVPVPCAVQNATVAGVNVGVTIADQGAANCTQESCGRQDGRCTSADVPANVALHITGFALSTRPPDSVEAVVRLTVDTNTVLIGSQSANFIPCLGLSRIKCGVRFNTADTAPNDNRIKATVRFSIDQKWDKLLAFSLSGISGTEVCRSSGAQPPPECLQPEDITLSGQNTCGNALCNSADLDIVKGTLLRLISPVLQGQLRSILTDQSCQACGNGLPACPMIGSALSVCQSGVCKDASDTSKCVPRLLGVEGRANLGATLGAFGAPASALDVSFAAGSSVTVDQGLSFGTRVGTNAVSVAPCVAPLAAPPIIAVAAPDFDAEAPSHPLPDGGSSREYHAALGFSAPFLNLASHEAQQAGALCLQLDTGTVALINSGLFKTLLPSLGTLATRDGKDAPMMISLRPGRPPTVTVGEGTFDPATRHPIKPLLRLDLNDLSIDFAVQLDDHRSARLFTLTADVSLPLSLIFQGCDKVTPAIGDLKMLITNVRTSNSEMLAEDPKLLADLIPAVIGLAEPAVAAALQPLTLPPFGNFKLRVTGVKGVGQIPGTDTFNHLALYAELLPANASCLVTAPKTIATMRAAEIPPATQMRLTGKPLPWPAAVLDVKASGLHGTPQFSVRIDDGLWSEFALAENGTLRVSHPRFLLQGAHTIWVRSRIAEEPQGVSLETPVPFFIDWDPPEVRLESDRDHDRIIVRARDVLTAPEELTFAYAVGAGAPSSFGAAREISLEAIERRGGVRVLVKDSSGNVGEARFGVDPGGAAFESVQEFDAPTPWEPNQGCAVASGRAWLVLLAVLGLARRRA